MTKQEFAQSIKTKYPQYSDMDDNELADKIIAKYPVYRSKVTDTEEKGTLRKIGDFFTSGAQKLGTTLGTAASVIDPETKKLREEALGSTNKMIDDLMKRASGEENKTKAKAYLEAAQRLGGTEDIDIFTNPEYQKTAKQIFGEGLETIIETTGFSSLGAKGLQTGKLGKAIPSAIKPVVAPSRKILTGAKEGATVGGLFGGGLGVSQAMQEDKSTSEIIKSGITGAAAGAAGGAVLGGGISALGAGSRAVASKASKLLSTTENAIGKAAYKKLNEVSRELVKMSPTQTKNETKWGKNTPKFLVDEGVVSLIEADGNRLNTKEALDALKDKYGAEASAFNSLLKDSGEYVSLNRLEERAIQNVQDSLRNRGSDYKKAVNHIKDEIQSYKENYSDRGVKQNGDILVNIEDFNKIKSGLWARTSNFNPTQSDKLISDMNYQMGQEAKELIEEKLSDVGVKEMNSRLGDFISAMNVLRNADGKVLPGGFFARQFARLAGTVAGSGGGITGSIVGNMTGAALADIAINPQIKTGILSKIYKNLGKTEKGRSIIDEAAAILEKRGEERASRLLLEESKIIPVGPKTDTSGILSQEEAQEFYDSLKPKEKQLLLPAGLGTKENPIITPEPK